MTGCPYSASNGLNAKDALGATLPPKKEGNWECLCPLKGSLLGDFTYG